jgi:hypothetical protein
VSIVESAIALLRVNWATMAVVGFGLGLLAYISLPVLVAPFLVARDRTRITDSYYGLAQSAFRRTTLLDRKHSGMKLIPSSFDAEAEAEAVEVDGDQGHAQDKAGWMGRAHAKPFGLVHEARAAFVHPMLAEIGKRIRERNAAGNEWQTIQVGTDDSGEPIYQERLNAHVTVPDRLRLIDPSNAKAALLGTGKLRDKELGEDLAEKSQSGFGSTDLVQAVSLIMALLAGCAAAWFIWSNSSGGGSSPVEIPIVVDAVVMLT